MKSSVHSSQSRRSLRTLTRHQVGILPSTPADVLLRRPLHILQRTAARLPDFRIELPKDGAVRMRTLVHRGTQRPVFKLTSLKLGRVVQCESLLETDIAHRLDAHPGVASYAEQPVRLHYLSAGVWRSHIPDFVLQCRGQLTFIEVKFANDVDDDVRDRTRRMETTLADLGARYLLLTEMQIRDANYVQNAQCLLRRARHAVSQPQLLRTVETLRDAGVASLASYGWSETGSLEAVCIAQLIVRGQAAVAMHTPLTGASLVWPTEVADQEVLPW